MAVGKIYLTGLTIPAAASVNAAASAQQRTVSMAADRSVIPLIYGEKQVPADLLNIIEHGTDPNAYLLQVMWGHACDSIGTPLLNGLAMPTGATVTHYTGTQTTPDAAMVSAFAAKGITYTDSLEGIAYSVLKLPTKEFTGELTVTAGVRGRKVYDPRKDSTQVGGIGTHRLADPSTWEWSDNPSLCLADWIDSATYGADDSVVWDSVPAAADANDALVGAGPTEKRRTLNLAITDPVRIADMAEALRVYAGCWLVPTRYGLSLLPDADDASVATYSHSGGQIAAIGSISTRDLSGSPTAVEVTFTDDSQVPSRDGIALAVLPGAGSTLPWRQSSVRLPGINRYSQAMREATERLNKLNLGAFSTTLDVFDIGIRHEVGDIITVSHPAGLVSAPMRITDAPQMPSIGHWRLPVTQHDPLAYDDAVATTPGYGDPGRIVAAGPPSDATGFSGVANLGLIRWRWDPCLDIDYGVSEIRISDDHWGDAAHYVPAFRGRVNEWQEQVTTPGTYTRHIRHYDKTELYSAAVASASVTVTDADLGADRTVIQVAPSAGSLTTDYRGVVTDFSPANAVVTVRDNGGNDVTGAWTLSKTDTGVATTLVGSALTVTGYDLAQVDVAFAGSVLRLPFSADYLDTSPQRVPAPTQYGTVSITTSGGPFSGSGYVAIGNSVVSGGNRLVYPFRSALIAGSRTNWSMSGWIYLTEYPGSSQHFPLFGTFGREVALNRENYSGANSRHYFSARYQGVEPGTADARGASVNSPMLDATALPLDTWVFVEATWSYADKCVRLFIGGVLAATSTAASTDITSLIGHYLQAAPPCGVMVVGGEHDGTNGKRFAGGRIADLDLTIGGTVHTGSYSPPAAMRATRTYLPAAQVAIEATLGGSTLLATYPVNTSRGLSAAIQVVLSRQSGIVEADYHGNPTSYSNAHVTVRVLVNGIDDSANWDIVVESKAETNDIAFTVTTVGGSKVITVTAMKAGRNSSPIVLYLCNPLHPTQYLEYPVDMMRKASPVVLASGPAAVVIAGDTTGVVPSSSLPVAFAAAAYEDGVDVTGAYTWSVSASSGITLSSTTAAATSITAMSAGVDQGALVWTGTAANKPYLVWRATVIKTKLLTPIGVQTAMPPLAVTAYNNTPGTLVDAKVKYKTNGTIEKYTTADGWTAAGNWYWPTTAGIGSGYAVKFMAGSGGTTDLGVAGPIGVWTALTSDVEYAAVSASTGVVDGYTETSNLAIRTTAGAVVAQGAVSLLAETNP